MIRWTERAVADLVEIGDSIGLDSPEAARSWLERLRERASRAAELPNGGRVVPEIARADVREVFVRNYRIVYRVLNDGIVVLTVVEGHRQLGELDPDADE